VFRQRRAFARDWQLSSRHVLMHGQ
jgi:hypothetical protein